MKLVREHFKSLEQYMETISERPLNAAFKAETEPSSIRTEYERKKAGRPSWAGTWDYSEAQDILLNGYREPLEKMKKAILKIGERQNFTKPKTRNDFVGFQANVPNYLMNLPLSMINRDKVLPNTKTIHLTYSFCAAAKTNANDLIKGGINFIGLVNSLEKQGYRVKIDIIFATEERGTVAAMTVNLKEYGQQTNLLKLAFPLVHPSMLRRFAFKWLETTPELKEKAFTWGYGRALNFKFNDNLARERDFLTENEIIKGKNSYYCNVYTALRAKSIEDLAEQMNILQTTKKAAR